MKCTEDAPRYVRSNADDLTGCSCDNFWKWVVPSMSAILLFDDLEKAASKAIQSFANHEFLSFSSKYMK